MVIRSLRNHFLSVPAVGGFQPGRGPVGGSATSDLRLEKEINFYPLQSWKKIVRPRVKFLQVALSQLALPQTGTFLNWHFLRTFFVPLRIRVPQLPVHPIFFKF